MNGLCLRVHVSFCSAVSHLFICAFNPAEKRLIYALFTFLGIHRLKQSMPKRKAGKMAKSYDPIAPVAEEISEEACLLCFDEFQVQFFNDFTCGWLDLFCIRDIEGA